METYQKDKQDQNKTGTATIQKTNEDFNKKQPDLNDPNESKGNINPEVPNPGIKKKENPDDIRMNRDANKDDDVNSEELNEDEEVIDNSEELDDDSEEISDASEELNEEDLLEDDETNKIGREIRSSNADAQRKENPTKADM